MKVMVTGSDGQLGYDVLRHLEMRGIEHKGVDLQDFDLTDEMKTIKAIRGYMPSAVVHCAAYTAVDKAEENSDICRRVNVDGTANVATGCSQIGAKMVYISTDYVFGGAGDQPFEVDDPPAPNNVYGQTKLDGEKVVQALLDDYIIARISWAFGVHGANFVKTMLRLGAERESLNVVCDQVGSPTFTDDAALLIMTMLERDARGVFHITNEGFVNWADFAKEIMKKADLRCKINPVPTSEYPTAAARPLNSRLSKRSLDEAGFGRLPRWEDALVRGLNAMGRALQ